MGFPVPRVEEAGAGKVKVSQSWFLADGSKVEPSEEKTWALPIFSSSRSTRDKPGSSQIFREKSFEVVVEGAAADDWLQINAGYLVPARVLYSKGLLKKLADGIR